ncbi:MAG: ATP-binding protein [Gammaproteobacteria bacterium]
MFGDILLQSQSIAGDVDTFIASDQAQVFAINVVMCIVIGVLFSVLAVLIVRSRRAMESRAFELEHLVEQRTATLAQREAEAVRRNEELARARDEARAANEAKGQFLANMSHEIRTPMHGVIGMASLLSRTELTDVQRRYVDTMYSSGLALLKIINAVLDYSKIEAGKVTLDISDFTLETVVRDVLHLFSIEASRKGLDLTSSIDPDVPKVLRGDSFRLGEILSNLVSNAIKFSDSGEISLACRSSHQAMDGDQQVELLFQVSDHGVGIPEEYRDYLFENFSQVDESSTRRHGGTGLGLAICRELATLMGGRIGVRSELGKGSTFWFTARFEIGRKEVVTDKPEADEIRATYRRRSTSEPMSNVSTKVLVIDDSELNRQVARYMLEELGFEVDLAADGPEAIDASARHDYAAILVDCQMPGMDGNETTRIIRREESNERHVPIIALSANATALERDKAFAAGVDDYLSKPLLLEYLEAALSRLLQGDEDAHEDVSATDSTPNGPTSDLPFDAGTIAELRKIRPPGMPDLFSDLAGKLLQQMPGWLDEIESAVRDGNAQTAKRLAHRLLGVCRQIGAQRMARVCAELESIALNSKSSDVMQAMESLREEFETVRHELEHV